MVILKMLFNVKHIMLDTNTNVFAKPSHEATYNPTFHQDTIRKEKFPKCIWKAPYSHEYPLGKRRKLQLLSKSKRDLTPITCVGNLSLHIGLDPSHSKGEGVRSKNSPFLVPWDLSMFRFMITFNLYIASQSKAQFYMGV
jgi:hypothetical protein